ncbi:MAG: TetR/AcrR family transcriptional regulator [Eubacterium sp.]|nr:TetR/AcrR family transcriptional regulator [Eubacterium sp.]
MKDKEATRQRILEMGKKAFIEKGFEGAYLRDIAKEAGVTTGAFYGHYKDKDALFVDLVRPVLDGLKEELSKIQKAYQVIDNKTLKKNPMILLPADDVVDYVFDHLDEVMLILKSADKTSLASWQDELFKEGVEEAEEYQRKWKEAGILQDEFDTEFISIITASYYKSIIEAVSRGFDRDKTKRFVNLLSIYHTGGLQTLAKQQK